jgi:hypothetical protein
VQLGGLLLFNFTIEGQCECRKFSDATYDGYSNFEMKGMRSFPDVAVMAYVEGSGAQKSINARQTQAVEKVAMIESNDPTCF